MTEREQELETQLREANAKLMQGRDIIVRLVGLFEKFVPLTQAMLAVDDDLARKFEIYRAALGDVLAENKRLREARHE